MRSYDAVVIGAGASGVGVGAALKRVGVGRLLILERERVGASFEHWARETRFISPSFTTNGFGMPDLNAVTPDSSPAYGVRRSHMSGTDYAAYLRAVVSAYGLPVQCGADVHRLSHGEGGFSLTTSIGDIEARFVIWAAGEHAYPTQPSFRGSELCKHTSGVASYAALSQSQPVVIGGFESGIDAAVHLVRAGKHVQVVDRGAPWELREADPSESLSPFTLERMDRALRSGRMSLRGGVSVVAVERYDDVFVVHLDDGELLCSDGPPLLATGYRGSFASISELFGADESGRPLLSEDDESTAVSGLFLVGPQLHHRNQRFCYIYKFRQRFAVVAACIAERLGMPTDPLDSYADAGMWLDDLSCCDVSCTC